MGTYHYRNTCPQMVILRCIGPASFFHEKVIFPFESWSFACPPESQVEIWSHGLTGAELIDSFPADTLLLSVAVFTPSWKPDQAPADQTRLETSTAASSRAANSNSLSMGSISITAS